MLDFTQKIEQLKYENAYLTNFKIQFNETELALTGEYIDEEGINQGIYGAGVIASFYIPTEKGYVSAEWKKTKFWKIKGEEITDELLLELEPYLQGKEETKFVRQTGCSVASAMANHINSKVGVDKDGYVTGGDTWSY